jgi:3-methyl-2-oxobutanoate hydroxymethyltransferase
MSRTTLTTLHKMVREGEKIATLTCYDASFAGLLEDAGVDVLLVGDSLGMVLQGRETTLAVTLAEMEYHTRCVAGGSSRAFIVADMPFGSYQENPQEAFRNAARLMSAGAHMVKLEGGAAMADTVRFLVERGIPVCGHLGLLPQSVHQFGGYRVQGREEADAARILADAKALDEAGVGLMVLEMTTCALARKITQAIQAPTIGIGAGPDCAGQVLVLYDALGIYRGKVPKFARNFMHGAPSIQDAVVAYVKAVKDKSFPAAEHGFD